VKPFRILVSHLIYFSGADVNVNIDFRIINTRQEENTILCDRVASYAVRPLTRMLEDGQRNFWREIKRIRCNKSVSSRTLDGLKYAGDIA